MSRFTDIRVNVSVVCRFIIRHKLFLFDLRRNIMTLFDLITALKRKVSFFENGTDVRRLCL